MQTMIAYSASIAQNLLLDIAPVPDDIIRVNNGHFVFGVDSHLHWGYLTSASIDRGQLALPSFRRVALPFIFQVALGPNPVTDQNYIDFRDNPMAIPSREELALFALQVGAGAERVTGIFSVGSRNPPAPSGTIYTLRGTSATAAVANTWTSTVVTWSDSLPTGVYSIVGLEAISTTCQAWRLILEGGFYRPGGLGRVAAQNRIPSDLGMGRQGELGQFVQDQMPIVQVLCNAADATQVFYLSCIKIR